MTHTLSHTITFSVCIDCYFYHYYSDESYWSGDEENYTEHLSEEDKQNIKSSFDKITEDYNISELDNDSDDTHFSWANCDMCGSSLGGDRHELLLTPIAPPPAPQDSKGSICVDEVEYSPYRWVITKVHLEGEEHVKGMMGGRDCDPNLKSNPVRFSLYTDDDDCYAEGMLYCIDGEEGCYEFAPLDDYGTPNWGCTYIKINGEIL